MVFGSQVLPAVVDQIVMMIKEELRRSGGDVSRAADQYVDTIVTNAVLSVRGKLNERQRDASKAFFVVSNDPTGCLNDNRSNSSWSQRARQLSLKYTENRRRENCSDGEDSDGKEEEDDEYYDDDDDMSIPMYPFDDANQCGNVAGGLSRSVSVSTTQNDETTVDCSFVDEEQDVTESVKDECQDRGHRVNDCDEKNRKCGRTWDFEQDSEESEGRRLKDSGKGGQLCAERQKKDAYEKTRPCDRKQKRKQSGNGKFKDCDQQAYDCHCHKKTKQSGSGKCKDRDQQAYDCHCHKKKRQSGSGTFKDRGQQSCDCDKKPKQNRRKGDCEATKRRCDQPVVRDDEDDDVMRCLQRRDDESIETYLIRSILLLGSLANESNSSTATTTGKSWIVEAIEEAVESVTRSRDPCQCRACTNYCSHNDDSRTRIVRHDGRPDKTSITDWLRSPMSDRNRFTSTAGNRYSGHRSTYAYSRGGSAWSRPAVSNSSSFNTMRMADSRVEDARSPRYRRDRPNDEPISERKHTSFAYRSNRPDRERFGTRTSRYSMNGAGNRNMHSNRADNATSAATADTSAKRSSNYSSTATTELNTNNSRLTQDSDGRISDGAPNDYRVIDKYVTSVLDSVKQPNTEPSTGSAIAFSNNSSSNNNSCVHNVNKTNDSDYYRAMKQPRSRVQEAAKRSSLMSASAQPTRGKTYTYRSNRTSRERFAVQYSHFDVVYADNFNANANATSASADNSATKEESGGDYWSTAAADNTPELNTGGRLVQYSNRRINDKLAMTAETDDFSVVEMEPSTGTSKPFSSSSNRISFLHNNDDTSRNNYYDAMIVDPANWKQDNTNNNNNVPGDCSTQKRSVTVSRRWRSSSRLHGRGTGPLPAGRRSAAALKAISCSAMEADAFLRQLESERLHPDVELLARFLDEYRSVLGLGGRGEADSLEAWPAAWRLARLPAGQWIVGEVLKQAQTCLSNFHAVKPSEFCRRRGLSQLGLALLGGVEDSLTSRLVGSVSVELEQVVLQRAVRSVVQTLVDMTSHHRHQQQQQQSVC